MTAQEHNAFPGGRWSAKLQPQPMVKLTIELTPGDIERLDRVIRSMPGKHDPKNERELWAEILLQEDLHIRTAIIEQHENSRYPHCRD